MPEPASPFANRNLSSMGEIIVGTSSWSDPGFVEEWYPDGFVQFQRDPDTIEADVLDRAEDEGWAKYKLGEFRTLNSLTIDELGRAIGAAGFRITKLQLLAERVRLPAEVDGMDLSQLGISGVMLLAE